MIYLYAATIERGSRQDAESRCFGCESTLERLMMGTLMEVTLLFLISLNLVLCFSALVFAVSSFYSMHANLSCPFGWTGPMDCRRLEHEMERTWRKLGADEG